MQTQAEQTPYDITIERFSKAIDRRPHFLPKAITIGASLTVIKVKLTAL